MNYEEEVIEDPFKFASEADVTDVVNTYLTNVNRFYMNLEKNSNPPNSANIIGKTYIYDLADMRDNKVKTFFNQNQDCFECHKLISKINHMISDLRGLLHKKFSTDPVGGKRKYKSRRYRKTNRRRKTSHRRNKSHRRK
jgi:hypothetical protein